jgi:hypothetical protein
MSEPLHEDDTIYRSTGGGPVPLKEIGTWMGQSTTIQSSQIADSTSTGRQLLTASSGATARAAIGAGSSDLTIGTTATTAKAGNYQPAWDDVSAKPAVLASGATQAAARTAIAAAAAGANTDITSITGSAATLTTARNIALTGAATGTVSFNGSANASIAVTLSAPSTTVRGGVLTQPAIPNATLAPTVTEWNNLLAYLRAAGILSLT